MISDQYTYTTLIDGLSKAKRLEDSNMVLEDMYITFFVADFCDD